MNSPPTASAAQPTPPKLLDQVRHKLRLKHHAASTEKQYVSWIRRFILFHEKRHPRDLGRKDVERFLTHLAVDRHVASSTQNQALAALLFLYREVLEQPFGWLEDVVRAKKPKRLPVVFSQPEAEAILAQLHGIPWLMAMLLYGSGLRLKECLRLRVKDLDFQQLEITVRDGKGTKDRVTILPRSVVEPLRQHAAAGTDIRTVQELLGHQDVRTTQIYTHVLGTNRAAVRSPADY